MTETASAHSETTIKVLSIDGGGIRGIIPAMILAELRERLRKQPGKESTELHEVFDLIAGTSTGGIIALAIGTPCHGSRACAPDELVDLYVGKGPEIFRKWPLWTCIKQLVWPKYSAKPLMQILQGFFGTTKLSSALTNLLISSYDIEAELPFFFKSHKIGIKKDSQPDWPVREIARATSAAPTFFPPARLVEEGGKEYALVDGGVCVNNPAMAAFAEARKIYPNGHRYIVVSVGTGDRQDHYQYRKAKRWGLLGWASKLVPVFMDSVSEAADYELQSILGDDYFRLQPGELSPASNEMDDVTAGNIANLQTVAHTFLTSPDAKGKLDKLQTIL